MPRGLLFAALCALTLSAELARAQGFGPDTATPALPADSGGAVVIAPQNDGSTQIWSATNPGESSKRAATRSTVVTNGPSVGTGASTAGSLGTNAILPDDAQVALEPVPDMHLVRRGDTLWDLCNRYYQNPWAWPKVWSYNPQIANPHWIYPGDQLRLTNATGSGQQAFSLARKSSTIGSGGLLTNRRAQVVPGTVFLRDQGYIGDPKRDVWGELVGSDEEQMMLAEGNHVVLILRPGVKVVKGQELTVFNSVRQPQKVAGARRPPGEIVAIRGTVKVIDFNPDTRMVRAMLTESVDVVERGALVGPVGRRFDVVPPLKTSAKVAARVLTSIYPNVYIARDQIAFLDKGSEDGLLQGSRLFVIRKGDSWRASLATASKMTTRRMLINSPEEAGAEETPIHGDNDKFPEDTVAELRVLRTEK
ncbi:MAG TPA: LysM peptidoglycan-binding domain-containing protein, partial [Polyangiaceae bacterium]|nr:LysM peptidoglycan-binding domain-containing protein [Polyangiaceae bacterium]